MLNIESAIVMVYELYKKARNSDYVLKPISYALYNAWKHFDKIESPRVIVTEK